ncbi:hypothetical protein BKK54_10350 [Rodentibacter genomosp. 1]|uniref:Uncharacterized protein n=1 Tax=Rodentibacter genomosp. 1 TaxID=1908264 RepID=A0A1V3J176_9PAST|nr:hypothetical protein [Rodentibacter genomosp. 1]OOF48705.1 hypothetical protein BKK54_10350 [Rodentibacter genomosp. 1]
MLKSSADKIALVMVRDLLRNTSTPNLHVGRHTALGVAEFVKTLSTELQKEVDDLVDHGIIINAYKNQSDK